MCIQFREDYPASPLFIELKSKTLSTKLLDGLTEVCEKECKRLLNKAQVPIFRFIPSNLHLKFILYNKFSLVLVGLVDFKVYQKLY